MSKLSWTPQRTGHIYCAPACGRGCTTAEYNAAQKNAMALVRQLGAGWEGITFENLGWHYKARHPAGMEVYPTGGRAYWATTVGVAPQHDAQASTARKAVDEVLAELELTAKQAQNVINRIKADLV